MASSRNKNVTVIFVLVLSLTFTTLAISSRSNRFVGNIAEESDSENRSSGNWTAVSGGRPVQSGPNTFHHHKSCTENGDSNEVAVLDRRPVRSGPNPYHHNDNPMASQP